MDEVAGGGTQKSHRVVREEENDDSHLPKSAIFQKFWSQLYSTLAPLRQIVPQTTNSFLVQLSKVLDNLGNKTQACLVPEALCCKLRERLCSMLELGQDALVPGPGGLFLGLFQGHVHNWLRCEVLLGITTHIPLGGVFPVVSPQAWAGKRIGFVMSTPKVWDSQKLLQLS